MGYPERFWQYRYLNRLTLKHATVITATSQALQNAARRWAPQAKSIEVIPFGIDIEKTAPKSIVPKQAVLFGMAKSLKPQVYGLELAIPALARVRQHNKTVQLELVGSGPAEKKLRELAAQEGVAGAVTFTPAVPQSDIPAVMRRFDVLLMPSRQESFGVAALDAQAAGTPVLAARTGGIPEVVREGITARFVEPLNVESLADAMLAVSTDTNFLARAHQEGPRFVRMHYPWSRSMDLMRAVYEHTAH